MKGKKAQPKQAEKSPEKEIPVPPQKKESILSPKKYERPKTVKKTSLPKTFDELMNKNLDNKDNIVKEKKTAPRELPMEAFPLDIEEKEVLNEIEQMKIKGFRTYFAEKEIENQKRKIIEMEQAERAKEEQKKVKQVMELINSSNLVSWDSEGRFLPLKYVKESEMKKEEGIYLILSLIWSKPVLDINVFKMIRIWIIFIVLLMEIQRDIFLIKIIYLKKKNIYLLIRWKKKIKF